MEKPTKVDKLFAYKAVEQRITNERKALEYECRDELVAAYSEAGTDRLIAPMFPDAGKFSIKRIKGKPAREVVEYNLADDVAFAEWLEDNVGSAISYVKANATDFARRHFEGEGELPEGISRVCYEEPATEPTITAQVYSFKPDEVFNKLAENGNVFDEVNRLMLGGGNE